VIPEDAARRRAGSAVVVGWFAGGVAVPVIVVVVLATTLPTGALFAIAIGILAAATAVAALLYSRRGRTVAARYRDVRVSVRDGAAARGWTWSDAALLPDDAVIEATFCVEHGLITPRSFTEVITGVHRGRPFTAGHLAGESHYRGRTGDVSENVVIVPSGRLLPLLRLIDTEMPDRDDYGVHYPELPPPVPLGPRWRLESPVPEQAAAAIGPETAAALADLPSGGFRLVLRAGLVIASGDPVADADAITARLDAIAALLDALPADLGEVGEATAGMFPDPWRPTEYVRGVAVWRR
jgi:hypothetical protein